MTILRWILLTALLVAFLLLAVANWTPVDFRMPDGTITPIRLPLLLAAAFVLGWLPMWLYHVAHKASLNRRLSKAERSMNDALASVRQDAEPSPLPSQAQPLVVPPAGA